jgi:hypothetical protein
MLNLAKSLNNCDLEATLFRISKLRHVAEKFEGILFEEYETRSDKIRLN